MGHAVEGEGEDQKPDEIMKAGCKRGKHITLLLALRRAQRKELMKIVP
jgi:hypothetical protein